MRQNIVLKILFIIISALHASSVFSQDILPDDIDAAIEEEEYKSSSWYFGFGLGTGEGKIDGNSFSSKLSTLRGGSNPDLSQLITINYGLGAVLTDWAYIGFDGSAIRQQASYKIDGRSKTAEFMIVNNLCAFIFYPINKNLFIKGGYGIGLFISEDLDDRRKSYSGQSLLLGTGVDFPLSLNFRMGIHAEYSKQIYNNNKAPDETNFVNVYVSFYWF